MLFWIIIKYHSPADLIWKKTGQTPKDTWDMMGLIPDLTEKAQANQALGRPQNRGLLRKFNGTAKITDFLCGTPYNRL